MIDLKPLIFTLLFLPAAVFGGNVIVKGKVVTPKGNKPDTASVLLVETGGAFSAQKSADKNGNYEFGEVPYGSYQLVVFGANYRDKEDVGRHEAKNISINKDSKNPLIYNVQLK